MSRSGRDFLRRLSVKCEENNVEFCPDFGGKSLESIGKDAIAKRCITYLSLSCFSGRDESLPAPGDTEGWLQRFPFFDYASNCWMDHIFFLVDILKNPTALSSEYGFDATLLEMIAEFLSSPNCWTYLEGTVLFSSARETRKSLHFCRLPIKESGDLWSDDVRKGRENPNARVLEDWALGASIVLKEMEDLPVEDALLYIRLSRDGQVDSTGNSLLEIGRKFRSEGREIKYQMCPKAFEPS
ncbi:MAG: hypothetical protein M1840_006364 [Geoglossum simile]|nr:MAG: hypothetical protein M1840_006364 [Geoglossum simile]